MSLAYSDAVRLLGGSDSRVVTALDRLTGGLLLAATAAGSGFALSLFEARAEFVRLSGELVAGLSERVRGLDRFSRGERLAAAHAVIVVAAFFEALRDADLPFDARDLELARSEEAVIATGSLPLSERLRSLADALLKADIPMPAPQWPYELTIQALRGFYDSVSEQLLKFVSGLAVHDRLDQARRDHFARIVTSELPSRAVADYEDAFRRLAGEFPEVAFWANLVDHQATREELRELRRDLDGIERALSGMAGLAPDERRSALRRAYSAALDRPFLASEAVPAGLTVPPLGRAYVSPGFRVTATWFDDGLGEESLWADEPVRDDLAAFMAGYLTAPQTTTAPLLVLGQPGSGKSVLTQVLAASLPAEQFLVVRVVLREVAADDDLQAQIEHGVRKITGETLTWPDLVRSRGDALPVVLLDGFDELLQATGVSQSDYLRKAAAFQAREADLGRPTAVVITSRTAVADRARPVPGMVALRLEPFDESRIRQWLEVWNHANADGFARLGLQQLPLAAVLAHAQLAGQPLLLAMLALYDADGNRLQHDSAGLTTADLYERLLRRFAEREIDRYSSALPAPERQRAIRRELQRLSLAAFSMFNRGRQWVSEAELDRDLQALYGQASPPAGGTAFRSPLSTAQITLSRFFFIYQAQAMRDSARLKTYEFLHATFGEFLLARLVCEEATELVEAHASATARGRSVAPDDAFMHALLSFMPLAMRGTVVSFLAQQIQARPRDIRSAIQGLTLDLFHDVMRPRHDTRYAAYTPHDLPVPARHATYSANLVTLLVLTGEPVNCDALFPGKPDPVREWRNLALLWRAQLPSEGWFGLLGTIAVDRTWHYDQRTITLTINADPSQPLSRYDPYWTRNYGPGGGYRPSFPGAYNNWVLLDYSDISRQAHFTADEHDDACVHALEPFADHLPTAVTSFCSYWPDRSVSAAHALIRLWLASSQNISRDELYAAYDTCLKIAINGFAPWDTEARETFRKILIHEIAASQHASRPAWLDALTGLLAQANTTDAADKSELLRRASDIMSEFRDQT